MSQKSSIRLFVIVPVYNNWTDTLECYQQLQNQTTTNFYLIVADDGSPDPPPAAIRDTPIAHYLHGPNLGFGGNCNRAANYAISAGATHLLLLNNDTEVPNGFIAAWLEAIQTLNPAIASPNIYWYDNPKQIWYSGGRVSLLTPFFRLRASYRGPTEVDIVCGCCMLVSAKAWRALHGFDTRYRMYYEDFDFSLRARQLGVTIHVLPAPSLSIRHKVSRSFPRKDIWRMHYALINGRLIFIRRHYRGIRLPLAMGLMVCHTIAIFLLNVPSYPSLSRLYQSIRGALQTPVSDTLTDWP